VTASGVSPSGSPTAELPSVSVVIPVYRDWAALAGCLEALSRQTYPSDRFEVIVVDNLGGLSLEALPRAPTQVRIVEELQPGSYAARNRGLLEATGDILAFTDADCIPGADWIERGVSRFLLPPYPDRVAGVVQLTFHESARRSAVERFEQVFAFRQQETVERWGAGITANLFVRRKVFLAVGPFSPHCFSGGDMEWGCRAQKAGYSIVFAPEARVLHPARRTWRELVGKTRRLAGGRRTWGACTPLIAPRRLDRLRFALSTPSLHGIQERAQVVAVLLVVRLVRLYEDLRLRLGGRPIRA